MGLSIWIVHCPYTTSVCVWTVLFRPVQSDESQSPCGARDSAPLSMLSRVVQCPMDGLVQEGAATLTARVRQMEGDECIEDPLSA